MIDAINLCIGEKVNWIGQSERLTFMGRRLYPDGYWYQFALVGKPDRVWCEVRRADLAQFEYTKEQP